VAGHCGANYPLPGSRRRVELSTVAQTLAMALSFPYTYYSCPCVYASAPLPRPQRDRKASHEQQNPGQRPDEEEDGDEQTFDPKSPRANYSLFPLEHLLWCTECHEMRCARCMAEEIVCWYCPTCLFEVPSSTVRTEGNRHVGSSIAALWLTGA
jgi:dynactin 4